MLSKIGNTFTGKATLVFNPVHADELAKPVAILLTDHLYRKIMKLGAH